MKSSAASLLAAHGLDAREIATRTDALGLTAERLTALSRCAPLAESSLATALDRFYARVTALPEFARLAAQPQFLQRLRDANAAYWRSLFTPQIDGDQVAERLAIGVAHHRARLQPAWYVVGCGVMLDALVSALLGAGEVEAALTLIDRVLFDIALSLDAYGMRLESELREGFSSAGQSTEAAAVDPVKPTPRAEPTPLSRMALAQDAAAQRREFIDLDDAAVRELRAAAAVIEATVPTVLADFSRSSRRTRRPRASCRRRPWRGYASRSVRTGWNSPPGSSIAPTPPPACGWGWCMSGSGCRRSGISPVWRASCAAF